VSGYSARASMMNCGAGILTCWSKLKLHFPTVPKCFARLYGALIFALGDRKLDVLLKDARTRNAPIFDIAKRTGVLL